ncbi:MAG: hypothetical protein ACI9N3_001851 [Colwellia sp.]
MRVTKTYTYKLLATLGGFVRIIGSVLFLFSSYSIACSCIQGTLKEQIDGVDFVYIGKVVSSRLVDDNEVENELIVIEELKGYPDINTLNSSVHYTSCDVDVTVGYEYAVFGNHGKIPYISACSSTHAFAYNLEERTKFKNDVKSIAIRH